MLHGLGTHQRGGHGEGAVDPHQLLLHLGAEGAKLPHGVQELLHQLVPLVLQQLVAPLGGFQLAFQAGKLHSGGVYHGADDTGDIFPYGFAATSGELDGAVAALGEVFQNMLKLAETEKAAQLMAEEIEKTRRRVNALEYVVIPNTQENIRYITMKLDENDRSQIGKDGTARDFSQTVPSFPFVSLRGSGGAVRRFLNLCRVRLPERLDGPVGFSPALLQ